MGMGVKILVMGLPGAGKTTLSLALSPRIRAVHFNADAVRREISRDLGFSTQDRVEQARRMGWLCDRVVEAGGHALADLVCPTPETRAAFQADGPAFIVWVDRISVSRFEDTNRLFVPPAAFGMRVTAEGSVEHWSERAASLVGAAGREAAGRR
jgi:adenylylsulfate kinase